MAARQGATGTSHSTAVVYPAGNAETLLDCRADGGNATTPSVSDKSPQTLANVFLEIGIPCDRDAGSSKGRAQSAARH
jgi:hypothetical protein